MASYPIAAEDAEQMFPQKDVRDHEIRRSDRLQKKRRFTEGTSRSHSQYHEAQPPSKRLHTDETRRNLQGRTSSQHHHRAETKSTALIEQVPKLSNRVISSSHDQIRRNRRESTESPVSHWVQYRCWPRPIKDNTMHQFLARKRSAVSLGRKRSNPSIASGASDDRQSEEKSALYRNPSYSTFLCDGVSNYKSYLEDHKLGVSDNSKSLIKTLLNETQEPPQDPLFQKEAFESHLKKLKGKNESRIVQDLGPLLVPSVETLASTGAQHLDGLVESVNEGWSNCFPITTPRPQPDSAFGFGASCFSKDQMNKLRPALGDARYCSLFKATYYMHFPFLTKEVKSGTSGLSIADNQNAHSMTIAVRAIVALFKLAGREQELHREIVAFSISHDEESVRIYAHYPIIEGDDVSIWRCIVTRFYLDNDTKFRTSTFTRNAFDIFADMHLKRIHSAIDAISSEMTSGDQPENSASQAVGIRPPASESSGLSQQFEQYDLEEQSNTSERRPSTPNTSIEAEARSPERKKSRQTLR